MTSVVDQERASIETLRRQAGELTDEGSFESMLAAIPRPAFILNSKCQIVLSNSAGLEQIDRPAAEIVGCRPGEAWQCEHARESAGGCGTSGFCRGCGAFMALANSQAGKTAIREWRVASREGESQSFRLWTGPLDVKGERFQLFVVHEPVQDEDRRRLEKIFFHDLLNMAVGLRMSADILGDRTYIEAHEELRRVIRDSSHKLVSEINEYRLLRAAQYNEYQLNLGPERSLALVTRVVEHYRQVESVSGKRLELAADLEDVELETDGALLALVMIAMLREQAALSDRKGRIIAGCYSAGAEVEFRVASATAMWRQAKQAPDQVPSLSAADDGEGLDSYAMRLLGDEYLKGRIVYDPTGGERGLVIRAFFQKIFPGRRDLGSF